MYTSHHSHSSSVISVPVLTLAVLVGNSLPVCCSKATTTSAATAQFFVSRPHQCGGAGSVLVMYFYVRVNGVPNFFLFFQVCVCVHVVWPVARFCIACRVWSVSFYLRLFSHVVYLCVCFLLCVNVVGVCLCFLLCWVFLCVLYCVLWLEWLKRTLLDDLC